MLDVSMTVWSISIVGIIVLFASDFLLVDSRAHSFTTREASRWVIFYVVLALAFAGFMWTYFGHQAGQEFIAGWITEYSLSIDNLFVFIVLMASFSVPEVQKHRVLLFGVGIAIVLRGLLIAVGSVAISRFEATFFVFGIFLFYTAVVVWRSGEHEPDAQSNSFIRLLERRFSFTRDYHDSQLSIRQEGKRLFTPMLLVMAAVGTTDVMFALDSIPAVFGLTQDAYIVFMVNAFALMGLRQLYFLLDGLLDKVIYLSKGLSLILGFIAVKLVIEAGHSTLHWSIEPVAIGASLAVIAAILLVTVIVSMVAVRRHPELLPNSELAVIEKSAVEHSGEAIEDLTD